MPVTWMRQTTERPSTDPYRGLARVHLSPSYDLLGSLRALYNPRTFGNTRAWAASAREALGPDLYERGRFFFQGYDTGLGYGVARLIADLPPEASPEQLLETVRNADARLLASYMLDTGETPEETLALLREHLRGRAKLKEVGQALRGLAPEFANRCRHVLRDPEGVQTQLVDVLEQYHQAVFSAELPRLVEPLRQAGAAAEDLLRVLPTTQAIENLAGGYTLGDDLPLRRITLAPSLFLYPYMSARVDLSSGDALIMYGVRTDFFQHYEPVWVDTSLLRALKALSDAGRLKAIQLLGVRPMYGPELVTALGLSQPTVHRHLATLRAAGLVRQERTKRGMRYTIRGEAATLLLKALERVLSGPE